VAESGVRARQAAARQRGLTAPRRGATLTAAVDWGGAMRRVIVLGASVICALTCAWVNASSAQAAWGEPNGCGTGGWVNDLLGANPYNDQFRPACDLHDWCYGGAAKPVTVGAVGDWLSRKRCDDLFYQRMLSTCGDDTACQLWASDYYDAVRTLGDSSLFDQPYTRDQREGQHKLLPNPHRSSCSGCSLGTTSPTFHLSVRGSNTTYWQLDYGGWHKVACPAWDPNHTACTADITLQVTTGSSHVFRVKAVDYYTGAIGHTWAIARWTS
jgi:hypothetical protein